MKVLGFAIMIAALAANAFAGLAEAPEVDGSTAASAVALLAGGTLVLRSRRK